MKPRAVDCFQKISYADAAYLANLPDLARDEYAEASDLFRSAPPTQACTNGLLYFSRLAEYQKVFEGALSPFRVSVLVVPAHVNP